MEVFNFQFNVSKSLFSLIMKKVWPNSLLIFLLPRYWLQVNLWDFELSEDLIKVTQLLP